MYCNPAAHFISFQSLLFSGSAQSDESITNRVFKMAVYLANLFALTSDSHTSVVMDTHINKQQTESSNLIVIGSVQESSWLSDLKSRSNISFKLDAVHLGKLFIPVTLSWYNSLEPFLTNWKSCLNRFLSINCYYFEWYWIFCKIHFCFRYYLYLAINICIIWNNFRASSLILLRFSKCKN